MTQYALEWSRAQNTFHIQPLAHACAKAQMAFIEDVPLNDYHVIAVGPLDALQRMADSWRERIKERDRVRKQPHIRSA